MNCVFRARFGPRRGDKKLVLKFNNLYHSGIDRKGKYDSGKNLNSNYQRLLVLMWKKFKG